MNFSLTEITAIAKATGFRTDMIEKVLQLLNLLDALNQHPFLKNKWALKGGTALNMFVFNLPRLSVDIDLNYIGTLDRKKMLEERPKLEQAFQAVFSRQGFKAKKIPYEHAGGKWRLSYKTASGQSGSLEVDINFMFRLPLWDIKAADSNKLGDFQVKNIPILDLHELAAGKLAALLSRKQTRDLFDCYQILNITNLNQKQLRLAFVVYGAMNRKDWRTVSIEDINFDPADLVKSLIPTLNISTIQIQNTPEKLGTHLVKKCKKKLKTLLPLNNAEKKFLDLLLDKGEINPSLLTSDKTLQNHITQHPLIKWKALNVKKYKALHHN